MPQVKLELLSYEDKLSVLTLLKVNETRASKGNPAFDLPLQTEDEVVSNHRISLADI